MSRKPIAITMNHRQGFSLVEIVSSLIIIGVALVAILGMFSLCSRSIAFNQERITVCNLLQRKLEEIKCKSFKASVAEEGVSYAGFPDYTLDVSQSSPYLENAYLKRVNVSVSWTTPFGSTKKERVSTLVARHGE